MDDDAILDRVRHLVDEEHGLRARVQSGELSAGDEQTRLRALEEALDQCWDLLRHRRALREAGEDPNKAEARPLREVEGYLQ